MKMLRDIVVFDMEANGLLYNVTQPHCITMSVYNVMLGKWTEPMHFWDDPTVATSFTNMGSIKDAVEKLIKYAKLGYLIVGHNIMGYDIPAMEKLRLGENISPFNIEYFDTMIGSCLRLPETPHNLDYYGKKFGLLKPAHEDWSKLSHDMLYRCGEDVKINVKLLEFLENKGIFEPHFSKAIRLEQEVSYIHALQANHGMRVDVLGAARLLKELDEKLSKLDEELHDELPKTVTVTGVPVMRPFLANGGLSKMSKDWFRDCGLVPFSINEMPVKGPVSPVKGKGVRIGGPFSRISFEPVNLGSHQKVKALLESLGWVPTEWNYKKDKSGRFERNEKGQLIKTSPKLTEDSYRSLPEGLGQKLATYLKLQHRRRFVANETNPAQRGLMSHVRDDGRVPCDALTCGTNTGRYRHMGAFVNLPKPKVFYGSQIRSLYCVSNESLLLGMDLDGIEARMMAYYAKFYDGGDYEDIVLNGDVHQNNADALGCDRETAKTFLYAISYGAKTGKLASVLSCSFAEADEKIEEFWIANSGLAKLIEELEKEFDAFGYITGLDGRRLYIRQRHKLMNTLIQNAAAIVFKQWMVDCYKKVCRDNRIHQVLAYHDELAWEIKDSRPSCAAEYAERFKQVLWAVGRKLSINVELGADHKIGRRYNEVH